jgi:NAD(P)-dependent dehydrogenase (short-subunit alcohol dehydrogenase family)
MEKKVCLLTGASGLFGTLFIQRFAADYQVAGVSHGRDIPAQAHPVAAPQHPSGPSTSQTDAAYVVRADLSRPEECVRVIQTVLDRFGKVDLLVHAAAIRCFSPLLAPEALNPAETLFNLNLVASMRLGSALAAKFWRFHCSENSRCNRNFINISSSAGLYVYPDHGQALYAASKAALNQLTYHMASEFWDIGVRVNAIAPDTFPGRVSAFEVIDSVHRIAHSDCTGQVLPICP